MAILSGGRFREGYHYPLGVSGMVVDVSTSTRIAAFALAFGAAFAVAFLVGSAFEPADTEAGGGHGGMVAVDGHADGAHGGLGEQAPGLAIAAQVSALRVYSTGFEPGRRQRLSFRIENEDGRAVRAFDLEHERRLHLIVVRRDGAGFQHLHPEMS